ncbi:MAG: hypothetical protein B7Z47_02195 [Chthoniobacter sp. 12-60-6]|nr:MAG: hypothetical protein B7Z47_02195 [Chthoniobacter sp. 12-60-6]
MAGGIRFGGSPGEQGQTLYFNNVTGNTTFNLIVRGGLDLGPGTLEGGPAYAFIDTGANGVGTTLRIDGQVTGAATLVKTQGQTLDLNNVNTGLLNTNSGGIQVQQGTLNLRGNSMGVPITGATIAASTTVTVPNTTGLVVGMLVSGPGIPANSTILTIPTGTTFTIGTAATVQTGPQTLFFFAAGSLNSFASGTPNVMDNATAAINGSPTAMYSGGIGSGALTLWGGTVNLRFDVGSNDTTRQRFWIGNSATGNSLIINGASTIDLNRNSGTYGNKHLAFKDLTIGSSTLSVTGGNAYVLEINGGTSLVGTPVLNVNSTTAELLLNGAITDGGSNSAIIKNGVGYLWCADFGGQQWSQFWQRPDRAAQFRFVSVPVPCPQHRPHPDQAGKLDVQQLQWCDRPRRCARHVAESCDHRQRHFVPGSHDQHELQLRDSRSGSRQCLPHWWWWSSSRL